MRDYEKLVKRCKAMRDYNGEVTLEVAQEVFDCVTESADAIEELSKQIKHWEKALSEQTENWEEALKNALDSIPNWIPVTDPPKEDGWYQVYAPGYSGGSSRGLKNINGNMYSAFKHGKWSIEVGYHKRPGCVEAWMPLPEPPKEEET